VHAAEEDHIGLGLGGLVGEAEGVADAKSATIGAGSGKQNAPAVDLVVVREDDGVALFFSV
jgi:hypothetical protein